MRVLHLISSGGMYGAEAVILQLSAEIERSGPDRSLLGVFSHAEDLVPTLHEVARKQHVSSELIACRGQLDSAVPGRIRALVTAAGADLIHAHGYKADIYAYMAFRSGPRPAMVSTCHTWYDNTLALRAYGAVDRWMLRHFDEVVAVSSEVQRKLLHAGVADHRVHLIRNGVSVPTSAMSQHSAGAAKTPGVRVGLVGRLAPEKGVDLFVKAVDLLKQRYPEAQFVVAGDGPDRASLETMIQERGLRNHVTLLGRQEDMGAFYASLDLLVSASRQEGLPMALLEGMAAGLPVVATTVGEVPQIVVHGETGLLVTPGDPGVLAAAVERMLQSPELRKSCGLASRQRILEEFSAKRMAEEYCSVYRQALARKSGQRTSTNATGSAA